MTKLGHGRSTAVGLIAINQYTCGVENSSSRFLRLVFCGAFCGKEILSLSLSLSLLQAVNPSGEGSATRVLLLHSALFSTSIGSSRKSSMLYFTTSIHLFLCLPLLRCPCTSASKILLTQSSSSRRCTCANNETINEHDIIIRKSVYKLVTYRGLKSPLFRGNNLNFLIFTNRRRRRMKMTRTTTTTMIAATTTIATTTPTMAVVMVVPDKPD